MTKPLESAVNAVSSVVSSVGTFASHAVAPLTSALTRAVTPRGAGSSPNITLPDPTVSQPGKQPISKPASRGMQSSFLSGVASGFGATGLGRNSGSGSGFTQGGKTLLGQ